MKKATVSVIIPTYNRAAWLPHAIDSVLQQERPPDELIIVDDGSEDETPEIVRRYADVIYVQQEQKGPSAARNTGVEIASGEWVAFLDSDDRWLPKKLLRQLDFLHQNPDFRAVYTNERWIRNGTFVNQGKRHKKYGGEIYLHCLPLCIISPSSILMHKPLFQELGGFDPDLPACEDYDLWLRLSAHHPVGFIDEALIEKYGGHEDQLSRQWGLDVYRVAALEKMLLQQDLRLDYRLATIAELVRRCEILEIGFMKNGKTQEAASYREKARFWKQGA